MPLGRRSVRHVRGSGDGAVPNTLFGLTFESVNRAQQFMLALKDLARDGKLRLADAVLVVKSDDQHVRVSETVDLPAGAPPCRAPCGSASSAARRRSVGWIAGLGIGAGLGAATAKVIDLGIPDDWVTWFKDAVRPDTATVLVLASEIDQRALGAEVDRFPNVRLVHTTIHADAFDQLRSAFSDEAPMRRGVHDD
ncbi:MAG: DUF1269 domain-containing protein [Ilumatobacteraceae bacterium]